MIHQVNLPVGTIDTIISIDNPGVCVPVDDVVQQISADKKAVRSMYSMPDICGKLVKYTHDISYLISATKEPITKQLPVKYFKISVKYFPSEKEVDLIVPSYVKFFSRTAKSYVPAEYIRKSDILTDYTGNIVQVFENVQDETFAPTEYYSMKLSTSNNKYPITFYYNGIFANIASVDFSATEK